jgi:hypothetical protein
LGYGAVAKDVTKKVTNRKIGCNTSRITLEGLRECDTGVLVLVCRDLLRRKLLELVAGRKKDPATGLGWKVCQSDKGTDRERLRTDSVLIVL